MNFQILVLHVGRGPGELRLKKQFYFVTLECNGLKAMEIGLLKIEGGWQSRGKNATKHQRYNDFLRLPCYVPVVICISILLCDRKLQVKNSVIGQIF